ncbi:MAG: NFACT RNA binding domain-containing protein [Clostridiaceae bacterium]|nr:NFACT RNA binding domain-containing protein [Clostridiaceae bacterium]
MALDGIFLNSLLNNLKPILLESKIDKINQPEKDEIVLTIRKDRKNHKLLISSSPKFPRIHFTEIQKENPLKAPMFLMVLRKYLIGGKILEITQKAGDRIVTFKIESSDEMGFNSTYSLIVEIMGRHSNISLVRDRDNKIMECIKHITPNINTFRVLYPGTDYVYPPASKKLNPFELSKETFNNYLNSNELEFNELFFSKILTGVSKPLSNDMYLEALQNGGDLNNRDKLFEFITNFINTSEDNIDFNIYVTQEGIYKDFYCFSLDAFFKDYKKIHFDNASSMLDDFYNMKDKQERLSNRSTDLQKLVHTNIERCLKKEKILNANLEEGAKKDIYKIKGDLLTSYIYNIEKGASEVSLLNFYSEENEYLTIALDPYKSPSENIQKYYKKYNKLKKAEEWAIEQLEKNNDELTYLNSVLTNIHNVDSYNEIDQIKDELMETGYIKFRPKKKGTKKIKDEKPLHFKSSTGFDIYVGKNNIQNDYLSLKFAHKNDLWFHTKEIPGSHVIVKGIDIDDQTLFEASILAAYYSKGKNSSKVAVDYTEVRNLKKPNGAKPGMVIYYTNKTLYADPEKLETLNIQRMN